MAENSINISRKVANAQEEFAKIETRAYINIKQMTKFQNKVGEPIIYDIDFINTGKTPAYKVRAASQWKTGTGVYPQEIKIIEYQVSEGIEATIGGGQIQSFTFGDGEVPHIFKQQDSISVFSGKYKLFVAGKIIYEDKFNSEHFTRFAFLYDYKNHAFISYKHFNDAN